MRNILSLASLFLALCATSAFSQSVAENIRPVGQLCVEGSRKLIDSISAFDTVICKLPKLK